MKYTRLLAIAVATLDTISQATIILTNEIQPPKTVWLLLSVVGQEKTCSSIQASMAPKFSYTIPALKGCTLKKISIATQDPTLLQPTLEMHNKYPFSINLYGSDIPLDNPSTQSFSLILDSNNQFVLSKKSIAP